MKLLCKLTGTGGSVAAGFGGLLLLIVGAVGYSYHHQHIAALSAKLDQQSLRIDILQREIEEQRLEPWEQVNKTDLREALSALLFLGLNLENHLGIWEAAPGARGIDHITMATFPTKAENETFRQSVILAFQALDERFQAIRERLDALEERDRQLFSSQEASRIALQTELNNWRQRHVPPVWDMAAQLSTSAVRFSHAAQYADPAVTEAVLEQVSGIVLAADPTLGVRVVGYADFDGIDSVSNQEISQERAIAVMEHLVRLGVPEERLMAVGRSAEDRVVASDEPGNANRRVIFEPFLLENIR